MSERRRMVRAVVIWGGGVAVVAALSLLHLLLY